MHFPNKTAKYFYKTSVILFALGSPNFWIEDLNIPKSFYKLYRILSRFLNIIIPLLILWELGAFITQTNLTKKQESDLLIYGISHPILWCYSLSLWSHDENVKKLFAHILKLKDAYNNGIVENKMLKKSKQYSVALALSCVLSVVLHTTSALLQYVSGGPFTTLITAWPLVDDLSSGAHLARIIYYIIWWVFLSRIIASYITIIVLTSSMSFQYTNLRSYFCSLCDIFEDRTLEQWKKESMYEEAFKLGVELHLSTVKCMDNFRRILKDIFSAQIVFVILVLVSLMTQMMKSERTLVNAAATGITATCVLISTGFVIWTAGDITVEASELPTAMYLSGWHNCRGKSSYAIRKLVVIAMTHAKKPVIIKGLGIITLSYQSYITLVKSSYSVFSVIY